MLSILMHEIRLSWRSLSQIFQLWGYLLLVAILFHFGLNSSQSITGYQSALIWVCVLLFSQSMLHDMFGRDEEDGTLDLYRITGLIPAIIAKFLSAWCILLLPLLCIAPVMGLITGLETKEWGHLFFSLIIGTPLIVLISATGSALSLGAKTASFLHPLLTFPLYVPVIIFSTALASPAQNQAGAMEILIGLFFLLLPTSILCCNLALKNRS